MRLTDAGKIRGPALVRAAAVRRCRAGITFLEVLVVLAILSLAIMPIFTLHQGQTRQAWQAGHLLRAHNHLFDMLHLEESRLYSSRFTLADESTGPATVEHRWGHSKVAVDESLSVKRSALTSGLWEIRAAIAWDEKVGGHTFHRELELVRLVAEPSKGAEL